MDPPGQARYIGKVATNRNGHKTKLQRNSYKAHDGPDPIGKGGSSGYRNCSMNKSPRNQDHLHHEYKSNIVLNEEYKRISRGGWNQVPRKGERSVKSDGYRHIQE